MLRYKCFICKAQHEAPPYSESFVLYDGHYYCCECLVKKRINPKTKKDRWDADADIVAAKMSALKQATNDALMETIAKDRICEHIEKAYAPSFIPKYFFMKLASVFDGSFKGLQKPIPASHLLDMWELRQTRLDREAVKRWGEEMPEPMNRINYDLAVLMNHYDSYLSWKAEKEAEKQEQNKQSEILRQMRQATPVSRQITYEKQSGKPDLASILDDLFD